MKSSAPWSVKGVERDARETAKEAARREGMTVGEWLNQVISSAGEPVSTDGQIEGLRISDLVSAIEHVSKRVAANEARAAEAFDEASRNLAGLVDRLQRLERVKPVLVNDDAGLGERLARLEEKASDRHRIDALKALEKAVTQVAVQFDAAHKNAGTRMSSLERQVQELAGRIEQSGGKTADAEAAVFDRLKTTIDGISARVTRVERSAIEGPKSQSAADSEFVERTGARLRALGEEIKRGGDQIRNLEDAIKRMSNQVDAAERRSSESVEKVADAIALLRSQMAEADTQRTPDPRPDIEAAMNEAAQRTDSRIAELQRAFEAILDRLEQNAAKPLRALPTSPAPTDTAEPAPAPPANAAQSAEEGLEEETLGGDDFMFDLDAPTEPETPQPSPATAVPPVTPVGSDDDIDSILAELEGIGEPQKSTSPPEPVLAASPRPTAEPDPVSNAPQSPNYLQEARRAARDAAEKAAAAAEVQQRRKLTPKQRALLAAKIRRKRLAEQAAAAPASAPAPAVPEPTTPDLEQESKPAPSQGRKSLVAEAVERAQALLRPKEPSADLGETQETEIETEITPVRRRLAVGGLKSKPLALGLGLAIALAAAALVFLVKDVVFAPKPKMAAAPEPAAAAASGTAAQPQMKDGDKPEVPAPPVVKPRTLYLDSVARLKAAGNNAETEAAMEGLRQAASLGHAPAQLQLGELYKLGQGVPQNPVEARAWYERAANGGNVLAMHRIGVMSARGQGGAANQTAAIAWFERAAELGLVDSQYNLGAIYHPGGEGETSGFQDVAKAYYWYALAARNGDQQAGSLAAGLASGLTEDRRREIDAAVAAWTAKTPDPDANEIAPAS